MVSKISVVLLILYIAPSYSFSQGYPIFQEEGGLVVIEAESAIEYFNWESLTTIPSFTGNSYLLYQGFDYFNTPGRSKLIYRIKINTAGKYRFQWRSRIAVGTSNTEHNDSWLRFPNATDFYAEKDTVRLYPKGVGKTPNPEGSTKEGWFKVYQNVRNNWTWRAATSDRDPHNIFVEFDSAGTYTMEIAGRSNGHALDRIVLYHSSLAEGTATNTNNPESVNLNPVSNLLDLEVIPLQLTPNPATETISVQIPDIFNKHSISNIILLNSAGSIVYHNSSRLNHANEISIPLYNLPPGMYWLHISNGKQLLRGKLIKQ